MGGVPLLQLGAGTDGRRQERPERSTGGTHLARGTHNTGHDRSERARVGARLDIPVGEQSAEHPLPGHQQLPLVGKCRKKMLVVTPARSAICAPVVAS